MRRILVGSGLLLIALSAALLVLFRQTEVARQLRQGTPVHLGLVALDLEGQLGGVAVISVLPGGRAHGLMVPLTLAWPASGSWISLTTLAETEGTDGILRRVGYVLEVPIAYWMVLNHAQLAKAVDLLGGVEVRVVERLVYQDRVRDVFLDLPPGVHTLAGGQVPAYLAVAEGGEEGRMARQQELLRGMWARLGRVPWAQARVLLSALFKEVRTNLSFWEALDLLRAARGVPLDRLELHAVPTVVRPGGKGELVVDLVRMRKLARGLWPGGELYARHEVRVWVLNGTRVRLLARKTGEWLADRGFEVVGMGDADRTDYARTVLVVREETRAKAPVLLEVLARVVPEGQSLQVMTDREFGMEKVGGWPKEADVVLILGAGFHVPS